MQEKIKQIIESNLSVEKKIDKIMELIQNLIKTKENKSKSFCYRLVPKSYAKKRIKEIILKFSNIKTKDKEDSEIFKKRYDELSNLPLNSSITVSKIREKGSYGQEYRDVINLMICEGKFSIEKMELTKKDIRNFYKRTNNEFCSYYSPENIWSKKCLKCKSTMESIDILKCPFCNFESFINLPTKKNICNYSRFKSKINIEKKDDDEENERIE